MTPAGYSGKPLAHKLGFKPSMKVIFVNDPPVYRELIGSLYRDITVGKRLSGHYDLIHFFTTKETELRRRLPALRRALKPSGMLWISWPKKTSRIKTDVRGTDVRNIVLKEEKTLVDVKICAVDDDWSGLKFVIRRESR